LRVNGLLVPLAPGSGPGSYSFAVSLALPLGQDQPLELVALDRAGNRTQLDYLVRAQLSVGIEIISPAEDSEWSAAPGEPFELEVTARLSGLGDESLALVFDGGAPRALTAQSGALRVRVPAPATPGEHTLALVASGAGGVAGQAQRRF